MHLNLFQSNSIGWSINVTTKPPKTLHIRRLGNQTTTRWAWLLGRNMVFTDKPICFWEKIYIPHQLIVTIKIPTWDSIHCSLRILDKRGSAFWLDSHLDFLRSLVAIQPVNQSQRKGSALWFPNQVWFWEEVVRHYGTYDHPYHPCMVCLPTFGWFLW